MAAAARTAEVVVAALLPRPCSDLPARSTIAPVAVALGVVVASAPLAAAVAVELAAATWGSAAVVVLVMVVALAAPALILSLASPPQLASVVARCAPLLQALDLGGAALARHWTIAATVQTCAPTAALAVAGAAVLAAHGEPGGALGVVGAAAVGAVGVTLLARRAARRLVDGGRGARLQALAARRLAVVVGVGCLLLISPQRSELAPTAVTAAGIAAAVWVAGDALAVDARPWLRLQVALIGCGAATAGTIARAGVAGAAIAAAAGGAIGMPAAALAGVDAGLRIGLAAGGVTVAALAVLALEPDARAALPRCLAFAVALSPGVVALIAGASAIAIAVTAALVGAVGLVALGRRLP
jgi:hypothetical protein